MLTNKSLKVLIIDDDDMMRSYLRIMLREADIENIDEAGTVDKAEKIINLQKVDLIFLDIHFPNISGIDGIDFISTIIQKLPDCRIIMVSSDTSAEKVQLAMQAGAKDFIAKPFNSAIVLSKLNQLVNDLI